MMDQDVGDEGSLVVEEQRFAVVPEWVIDAELSDAAFRVYSLLLRYGNGSGCRMPSRALLARRLHRSVDSIDRAMRELASAGVVRVERRRRGRENLTNRYYLRTSAPAAPVPEGGRGGGRNSAATGGRSDAATLAAGLRPDPKTLTDTPPPPRQRRRLTAPAALKGGGGGGAGAESRRSAAATAGRAPDSCGVPDLDTLAAQCLAHRRALGLSTTRWQAPCLAAALHVAVVVRGWPSERAEAALLAVAADPQSRSPMRVAEAGPWWDSAPAPAAPSPELESYERRLDATDGHRPALQARARAELTAQGLPVTRATVAERACQILDRHHTAQDSSAEASV